MSGSELRIVDGQPNTDLALLRDCYLDTRRHASIFGIIPGHSGWLIPSSAEMNEALKIISRYVGGRGAPGWDRIRDQRF